MERAIDASKFGAILEQWKKDFLQDDEEYGASIIADVQLQLDDMPTLTVPPQWISVGNCVPKAGECVLATDGVFVGEAFVTTRRGDRPMPEHILSLSYGKDSLACLGAIEELGWPLDRIVHAEVYATDTIPADLPPMVEFKTKADRIIKERWGIEVEHVSSGISFEQGFYFKRGRTGRKTKFEGKLYGWPMQRGQWCLQQLKLPALSKISEAAIQYIGIASDEPNRFGYLSATKKSPLVEAGWTEADCRQWCEENDLLSPIYTTATRGGCWFCHNQGVGQLRLLRKNYPDLWALMLKWDKDSPVTFKADGHTVHDFDRRFQLEDEGLIYPDDKIFRWTMLDEELNYRLF